MTFTTVAISGATGNLGVPIANSLIAKKNLKIKILTRQETLDKGEKKKLFDEFTAAGAQIVAVDFKNVDSIAKALAGVEVVVSVVAGTALTDQIPLIQGAKKAGVKRFYPSEYGVDDNAYKFNHPIVSVKQTIRKEVIDAGLELVTVSTGFFLEWAVSPFYAFDPDKKTVDVVGDGNTKVTFTALGDIGSFIAESINHPLTSPGSEISPRKGEYYLPVGGFDATYNELLDILAKSGQKYTPTYHPVEAFGKKLDEANKPWDDFGGYLRFFQGSGTGNLPKNYKGSFPSIKPKTFADAFPAA
jgi:uncharacterized protein YbjT (DUF2867 family)